MTADYSVKHPEDALAILTRAHFLREASALAIP
jgi:hypothetical protein